MKKGPGEERCSVPVGTWLMYQLPGELSIKMTYQSRLVQQGINKPGENPLWAFSATKRDHPDSASASGDLVSRSKVPALWDLCMRILWNERAD